MTGNDRQLKLEIIWKDDYMIEVRAFASNGRYSGTTEVYTGCEDLLELSNNLRNFPKTLTDTVSFEAGERGISPFLSLRFYCFDGSGHTAVEVSMEENVPTTYRPEEKHTVSFELQYEAGAIDAFQKAIADMASNQIGAASLFQDGH